MARRPMLTNTAYPAFFEMGVVKIRKKILLAVGAAILVIGLLGIGREAYHRSDSYKNHVMKQDFEAMLKNLTVHERIKSNSFRYPDPDTPEWTTEHFIKEEFLLYMLEEFTLIGPYTEEIDPEDIDIRIWTELTQPIIRYVFYYMPEVLPENQFILMLDQPCLVENEALYAYFQTYTKKNWDYYLRE